MHYLQIFSKRVLLATMLFISAASARAWGPEGHAIVGRLAMQFVNADVRKNVLFILGNTSIDTAANWMDIIKSNSDYDFMRSWHYLDFAKGKTYEVNNADNIINRLLITYNELGHKKTLCSDQIRTDLFILLHLMGDLHMPLHTGYDDDLGGNKVTVQYDTIKTHNLHRFWDEDIIALTKITDDDCMQLYKSGFTDSVKDIDFVKWMQGSRSLLPGVYDFEGFLLPKSYLTKNKVVVERQLLLAGLRLAKILEVLFASSAPAIDYNAATKNYKNGINIKDAAKYIDKNVAVCAPVGNIKSSEKITQIYLLDQDGNTGITAIIFGKNYSLFPAPPTTLYKNKNVCVKGKVELYNGKTQIIVNRPEDITVQ